MNVRQKLQLATSVSFVRLDYPRLSRFRVIFYIQIKQSIGFCDSISGVTMESAAVLKHWRLKFSGNIILT